MSLPAQSDEKGGSRNRVCKQCKFTCSDAKEFYQHQLNSHGATEEVGEEEEVEEVEENFTCQSCGLQFELAIALEEHSKDNNCALVSSNVTEEPTGVHTEQATSAGVVENAMNVQGSATNMQLSPAPERPNDVREDVVNNNERVHKSAFLENNPDYPGNNDVSMTGATQSPGNDNTANATANDSGLARENESHNVSGDLDEGHQSQGHKLDISDDNIELVIDEDANNETGQNVIETPQPYIDIKPIEDTNDGGLSHNTRDFGFPTQPAFSLINPKIFSPDTLKQMAVFPGRALEKVTPVKNNNMGLTSIITPPRRCAPVREAVDPAKYITVQEGDGVKYACSKCGNIYKWRKSLNKHWKEKHEGEIPEPRTNTSLPRIGSNAFPRVANHHVSPRQPRPSPARQDLYSVNINQSTFRQKNVSPVLSYQKIENPFDSMRPGSLKSSPSPNSRSVLSSLYGRTQTSPLKRAYSNNPIFDNILKQQQFFPRFLDSQSKSSSPSPPAAHTSKPQPTNIPRPSTEPMDLTRELSGVQEGVLDLSMKSSRTSSARHSSSVVQTALQDEPLDFSKPVKHENNAGTLPKPVYNATWISQAGPKQDVGSSFVPKSMTSPVKESTARPKQCKLCSYVTRDEYDMEKHALLHATKEIACSECQETFQSVDDLNQHFVLRHMQVLAKRMAQIRNEHAANTSETGGSDQLYEYLTRDSTKPISSCIVCGARYQFQWALAKHFDHEHVNLPNPYRLPDSPEINSPSPRQEVDQSTALESEGKLYKCSQCPFTAGSTSELTRHQIRHSLNKHHVCKVCGYTEKTNEELMEHYEAEHPSVHPADIKSSTGTVMLAPGDDSDDSQNEPAHIIGPDGKSLIDLGGDENTAIVFPQAPEETNGRSRVGRKPNTASSVDVLLPYKCSVCEYRARWPSEITQHMKNHSDEKPFRCPRCTYKSKWKWDVVKHLKRCGGGTVKDVIDITKVNPFSLMRSHSPENLAPTQARELSNGPPNVTVLPSTSEQLQPFNLDFSPRDHARKGIDDVTEAVNQSEVSLECSECSFVASNLNDMRKHSKFHTYDVQQVYCSQCPFVGNNPAELKRHLRVHSDEKPFVCKTCGYSSKWKCDLKKHCKTYNHQPTVPLTYGGHGRKPQTKENDGMEPLTSDDQNASEYDSADTEYNGDNSISAAEHGLDISGEFACELCPYSTVNKAMLHTHMKIHTKSQFNCKQCDYEGNDYTAYLQHKQTHYVAQTEPMEPTEESASLESEGKSELNGSSSSNRRKQSKQSIMKNNFDIISAELQHDHSMNNETNANLHEKLNTPSPADFSVRSANSSPADLSMNSKSFSSPKCSYTTNSYQNYERHLPSHEKSETRYSCEWCTWSSDQMYMLYRHAQVAHAALLLDMDKEAFYERIKDRSLYENAPKWTESPSYPSPSASPALSPVTGKPMYSEGKKTKRRLKSCSKCGYITDNVTTLQRHMAKHGKQGKYKCTHCDYSVDKQHVVEYHIRLVHGPKADSPGQSQVPISSPVEPDNNSSSTVDLNDASSVDNLSTGEVDCVDFENADISQLKGEDVKIVHIGNRTVYGCSKCPYNTMKVRSVLKHCRQHGVNKIHTCSYCDYSVDHASHLRAHMKAVHGDCVGMYRNGPLESSSGQINGDIHADEFDDSEAPNSKKRRYDSSTDTPFSCSNCDFEGENMTELVGHQCTNPQQLKCEHCDYIGSSSSLMKLHAKTHALKSNGKMHTCDRCPYRTGNRSQLDNHKKRHGLKSKHDCPYCDYSCGNLTQQGNHVKLHFPKQNIDKNLLHLLMKGETIPGFIPQIAVSDSDIEYVGQGQVDMEFDDEQDDEDGDVDKYNFDLNANRPLNGQLSGVQL